MHVKCHVYTNAHCFLTMNAFSKPCACIYAYMNVHTSYTHSYTHIWTQTYCNRDTHHYIYIKTHLCQHIQACVNTHAYVPAHMHSYTHTCAHKHTHAHTLIHSCIHAQALTHTCARVLIRTRAYKQKCIH